MLMKTSELTGAALDWAVAKAWQHVYSDRALLQAVAEGYKPSTDWSQGGPIIEREVISISCWAFHSMPWKASIQKADLDMPLYEEYGLTPLIAAMRCYVASKLGDDIDVPAELTKE